MDKSLAFGLLAHLVAWWIWALPPVIRILKRVGFSGWWAAMGFVPLIGLWVFAFSKWPSDSFAEKRAEQWSEVDNATFKTLLQRSHSS